MCLGVPTTSAKEQKSVPDGEQLFISDIATMCSIPSVVS